MSEGKPEYTPAELSLIKTGCQKSLLFAMRVFFKERENTKLIVSLHHKLMAKVLDLVIEGKIKRLIINVPPGYTKTETAVIGFILKGWLVNPQAKFLHLTYSKDLALENSSVIKDTVKTDLWQAIQPGQIRKDKKGDGLWKTDLGGMLKAAPTGGQITGFRAGRMNKKKFTGAIIVDDPNKTKGALSKADRDSVNKNFNNTIKSRVATEEVPIIVIQQRVHDEDLSGYLLEGGTQEMWYHVNLPALVPEHPTPYPAKWKCGIPINHKMPPGPLWEYKHNLAELKLIQMADKFVWAAQYQQNPGSPEAQIFKRDWFFYFNNFDPVNSWVILGDDTKVPIVYKVSFADTAMKAKESNDFSVFMTWGMGVDGRIYLLELIRGKWEAPDLEKKYIKYLSRLVFKNQTNNMAPRGIYVEDKASGTGLIQSLNRIIGIDPRLAGLPKITGIQRNIDKVSRAYSTAPKVEQGLVVLPENAYWLEEFLAEIDAFNAAMTHKHDDQIDPMMDAVHKMLIENANIDYNALVGM